MSSASAEQVDVSLQAGQHHPALNPPPGWPGSASSREPHSELVPPCTPPWASAWLRASSWVDPLGGVLAAAFLLSCWQPIGRVP